MNALFRPCKNTNANILSSLPIRFDSVVFVYFFLMAWFCRDRVQRDVGHLFGDDV
jgi:hypothetical protein